MKYRVSIIMEAYNEDRTALAEHPEAVEHLLRQDFPLEQVELVLVGGKKQLEDWKEIPASWNRFGRVRLAPMENDESHYWEQKNFSVQVAEGEIIAWVDSDVKAEPTWLAALVGAIDAGADVSVGPSLYAHDWFDSHSPALLAAASVSWGFVLSIRSEADKPIANSLVSHNAGIRREVALQVPYRTGQRSFQSSVFYRELREKQFQVVYSPGQRAAHQMTFWWWVTRRHFRSGWETENARREKVTWPKIGALEKVPWLEPIVLNGGFVLRDLRQWFLYRRVTGVSAVAAWLMLPLIFFMSAIARGAEMVGMYCWMVAPKRTAWQARF
ncbi:MAG: glycosyltransferase [Acidobacteria bacterium]|nr:glycosyltransferase [Acidobacteriota bacterium]